MPKGIPTKGKRAAGGGRKPLPKPALVRMTVHLRPNQADALRAAAKRSGNKRSASWLLREMLDAVLSSGVSLDTVAKGVTVAPPSDT